MPMLSAPDRQDSRHVSRADLVIAAGTWMVATAGLVVLPVVAMVDPTATFDVPPYGSLRWWAVLLAVTAQGVAVAWARRRPVTALLGAGAIVVLLVVARPGDAASMLNPAVLVVVFRAASTRPLAELRLALVGTTALVGVGSAADVLRTQGAISLAGVAAAVGSATVIIGLGLLPGLAVASRRAVLAAKEGELHALARERDARLRIAVAAERTAMAREVHDIAAHHLSGMALMLSAIDRQVDSDPAAAHAGVRQVRAQTRVVLNDLRRLVGILREDGAAEALGPLTLAALPELVEAAGRTTTLEIVPSPDSGTLGAGVGPVAQLAAFRMVQESLSNARHHAPGARCVVTLDDSAADVVSLTVRNGSPAYVTPSASAGGHGLLGMRERADLVGATVRHGPTTGGGWEVWWTIPRDRTVGPEGGSA